MGLVIPQALLASWKTTLVRGGAAKVVSTLEDPLGEKWQLRAQSVMLDVVPISVPRDLSCQRCDNH